MNILLAEDDHRLGQLILAAVAEQLVVQRFDRIAAAGSFLLFCMWRCQMRKS